MSRATTLIENANNLLVILLDMLTRTVPQTNSHGTHTLLICPLPGTASTSSPVYTECCQVGLCVRPLAGPLTLAVKPQLLGPGKAVSLHRVSQQGTSSLLGSLVGVLLRCFKLGKGRANGVGYFFLTWPPKTAVLHPS